MTAANSFTVRQQTVLLVGKPCTEISLFADRAAKLGWRTVFCADLTQAGAMLSSASEKHTPAIILDEDCVNGPIWQAVADLRRRDRSLAIVAVVSNDTKRVLLDTLRAGAGDCVAKPVSPEQLLQLLRKAMSRAYEPFCERESFADELECGIGYESMIEADPSFRAAWASTLTMAQAHGHVLIEGEPGTGKSLLARAVHAASQRSRLPLHRAEFSRTTAAQIEASLFGYERGAFVGAFEARAGLLEQSHDASLMIDDVESLPVPIQERLAEALLTGRALRLGGAKPYGVDVRLIALARSPVTELVEEGAFSPALYKTLEAGQIHLPALRERPEDIPLIARAFVNTFRDPRDLRMLAIDDDALAMLSELDWPGNSRQLLGVLLRAVAASADHIVRRADLIELTGTALPESGTRGKADLSAIPEMKICTKEGHVRSLDEIEAEVIRFAIKRYHGRMAEVARRLKIGRSTLYRKAGYLGVEATSRTDARD